MTVTTTSGFGWFVSWISSVVSQQPHTLQELRRVCGSWSEVIHLNTYRTPNPCSCVRSSVTTGPLGKEREGATSDHLTKSQHEVLG
jgi:hypothetical protein